MKQPPQKSTTRWEWLEARLPILNITEVCRRAGVPRHRVVDTQRGRQKLSQEDLDRIGRVIRDALE